MIRHSLLLRQLRKHGLGTDLPPALLPFLKSVEAAYDQFDTDRRILENAMDFSSRELFETNARLVDQNARNLAVLQRLRTIAASLMPAGSEGLLSPDDIISLSDVIEELVRHRQEAERALRTARDTAESANRAKSDFLANVSHEIRTPMNAIIGMTSVLLNQPQPPGQLDYLTTIRDSADSLLHIINELLDFSKIEAGRLELETSRFNLHHSLEQIVDLFATRAAEKSIDLALVIDRDVPGFIVADPVRLRQILVNLMGNAVKFTEHGGVTLAVSVTGGRLHFSVEDTGIGIPREAHDRLFKSFSQVDSSMTRRFGGTGLGLAISKSLVELMGGRLDVASEPGAGSRFFFSLPLPSDAAASPECPLAIDLSGYRVLLSTGHSVRRAALARQLEAFGASVVIHDSVASPAPPPAAGDVFSLWIIDRPSTGDAVDNPRNPDHLSATPVLHLSRAKPVLPRELLVLIGRELKLAPGAPVAVAKPASRHDAAFAQQHPLEILVVEDNAVNTKVLLLLLGTLGYGADTATNGREALQRIAQKSYDLVVMDLQMPVMDGLEATRQLRQTVPLTATPYILGLSANARREDREACIQAGMHDFLSKPVRIDALAPAFQRAHAWIARR